MLRRVSFAGLLALGMLLPAASGGTPVLADTALGTNLIVNGGAEQATGSNCGQAVTDLQGWTVQGDVGVVTYANTCGFPTSSDPNPGPDRGLQYFVGGTQNSTSVSQTITLASNVYAAIDAGTLSYNMSAWLGGYQSQADNAQLTATFFNAASAKVGSATVGPVTPADRANVTGFIKRATNGTVPVGTRSVGVVLLMTKAEGTSNDGYADNLFFSLSTGGPTASRVSHLSVHHSGNVLTFGWQVPRGSHLAGFDLYAGAHRLNGRTIPVHPSAQYRYAAHWTGHGPYSLHVLLPNGRSISLPVSH